MGTSWVTHIVGVLLEDLGLAATGNGTGKLLAEGRDSVDSC